MTLRPKYSIWDGIQAALGASMKALNEVRALQKAIAAMMDGTFGLDDFDIEYDGERTIAVVLTKGAFTRRREFVFPVQIYRGIWDATAKYVRGDAVTWAGAQWVAKNDTTDKPGEGGEGWQLSVKKGRDGRDGKDGGPPVPPKPVKV
jgi:hypothetical protein